MLFVTVVLALTGVVAALLWFTGWAEQRVIEPKTRSVEADTR
jgi:hypothetical protein